VASTLTGGNLTGVNFFSTELAAKRLELLRALVPGAARVAVLGNAMRAEATVKDVQAAAAAMGLQIQVVGASISRASPGFRSRSAPSSCAAAG
jgi:ABC-type uncharacterized transport system substrate-binding protein